MPHLRPLVLLTVLLLGFVGCGGSSTGIQKPEKPAPMPDPGTRISGAQERLDPAPETRGRGR